MNELRLEQKKLESKIEEYATSLRATLEELAENLKEQDMYESYFTPSGRLTELYEIEDMTAEVNDIETLFWKED